MTIVGCNAEFMNQRLALERFSIIIAARTDIIYSQVE